MNKKLSDNSVIFPLFVIFVILIGCKSNEGETKNTKQIEKKNSCQSIILLDLSDRILKPNQIKNDKDLISIIINQFEGIVRSQMYISSVDNLDILIAEQRDIPYSSFLSKIKDSLYIRLSQIPPAFKKRKFDRFKVSASVFIDSLYNRAIFTNIPTEFKGADIAEFFIDHLQNEYLSKNDSSEVNIFIITDGYPIAEKLTGPDPSNLPIINLPKNRVNVMLLEITPDEAEPRSYNKIIQRWFEWFDKIGVKNKAALKYSAVTAEKAEKIRLFLGGMINEPIDKNIQPKVTSPVAPIKFIKEKEKKRDTPSTNTILQPTNSELRYYKLIEQEKKLEYFLQESPKWGSQPNNTVNAIVNDIKLMLLNDFPDLKKNPRLYSLCCSYKTAILNILERNASHQEITKLSLNFKSCPY